MGKKKSIEWLKLYLKMDVKHTDYQFGKTAGLAKAEFIFKNQNKKKRCR